MYAYRVIPGIFFLEWKYQPRFAAPYRRNLLQLNHANLSVHDVLHTFFGIPGTETIHDKKPFPEFIHINSVIVSASEVTELLL